MYKKHPLPVINATNPSVIAKNALQQLWSRAERAETK